MTTSDLSDEQSAVGHEAGRDQKLEDLEAERDFLLRSIEDLDAEYEAGDVPDDDYTHLHDRYTQRAAGVLRAIAGLDATAAQDATGGAASRQKRARSARPGRSVPVSTLKTRRRRKSLLFGGVALLLGALALALVLWNSSDQLPGNTITGGATLPEGQQIDRFLSQAAQLEGQGDDAEALQVYDKVLSMQPKNADALSQAGWLEFTAGVDGPNAKSLEDGEADENEAVSVEPGLEEARAYLGTMLFVVGQPSEAVIQYSEFISDHPSSSELSPFLPDIKRAYSEAKVALPATISRSK